MRIKVYKPVNGKVRILVDDRRGPTRGYVGLEEVPIEDIASRMAPILDKWEKAKAARRPGAKP